MNSEGVGYSNVGRPTFPFPEPAAEPTTEVRG